MTSALPQRAVLLIRLNEEFAPLKAYTSSRAKTVGNEGVACATNRYAIGFGVYLVPDHELRQRQTDPVGPQDPELTMGIHATSARGALAVSPDFDALTSEVGLDGI